MRQNAFSCTVRFIRVLLTQSVCLFLNTLGLPAASVHQQGVDKQPAHLTTGRKELVGSVRGAGRGMKPEPPATLI